MTTAFQSPARLSKASFTLIELLTVVAIIGVLAALLVPALGRARERGRQVGCSNNLRQIGQGIAMFASDNNGVVPYSTTNNPAAAGIFDRSNRSLGLLSNYVSRSVKIFRCPSDTRSMSRPVTNFPSFLTITNSCSYSIGRNLKWRSVCSDSAIVFDRVGISTNGFELLSPTNGIIGATWARGNHKELGIILFGAGHVTSHPSLPVNIKEGPREWSGVLPAITVQNPL
jgi:prepilin-type N-terminal cleavage/methylation domain-containing protein